MNRFRPHRASPPRPSRRNKLGDPSDVSSSVESLSTELQDLSLEDIELLDTIIKRAGPTATTFLTIFKAYSEVLAERHLDSRETVYYGKLLKLGTLKGRNWGDKWDRVKLQCQKALRIQENKARGQTCSLSEVAESSENETVTDFVESTPRTSVRKPATRRPITSQDVVSTKPNYRCPADPKDGPSSVHPLFSRMKLGKDHKTPSHPPPPAPILSDAITPSHNPEPKAQNTGAINEAETWKKIRMQHDEENADLFRQDRLMERYWDIWIQGYRWILTTNQQVSQARDHLLLERFLEKWRAKAMYTQDLCRRSDQFSRLCFIRRWKTKLDEIRQKKLRQQFRLEMRQKMKYVRQQHEFGVLKVVWLRWRRCLQIQLIHQTYLQKVTTNFYYKWKTRVAKLADANLVADEVLHDAQRKNFVRAWEQWRTLTEYVVIESTIRSRMRLRILDDAMRKWRQNLHDHAKANHCYNKIVKRRFLSKWFSALSRIKAMENRAARQLSRTNAYLLFALTKIWKDRANGAIFERRRLERLKLLSWKAWMGRIQQHHADFALAERFAHSTRSALAITTLHRWREAYDKFQSVLQLSDGLYNGHLAVRFIHHWRKQLRQKIKMIKMARAASKYFLLRRTWVRWVEQIEIKRREQLLQFFIQKAQKRKFDRWLQKTRVLTSRKLALQQMQERVAKRIVLSALERWIRRTVEIKDREFSIVQQCNMVVVVTAFEKWRSNYHRRKDETSLMQSYILVREEGMELLYRSLLHWLSAARVARHRRLALQESENKMRLRILEDAWDRWREKRFESAEINFMVRWNNVSVKNALRRWHDKTKAPPAIQFHALRVKRRCFAQWKEIFSRTLQLQGARQFDRKRLIGEYFIKWSESYKTKKMRKAIARARHLRLPAAPAKPVFTSLQPNPFPKRRGFIRNQPNYMENDQDDDTDPNTEMSPIRRPQSATSSTYIGGKSIPKSVISSSSRYVREPSPIRAPEFDSISRARSETKSPVLSVKKGPSSVASVDPPRRVWPDIQDLPRRSRLFFNPKSSD